MTPDLAPSTPNLLKERDPELLGEVKDFRVRFEEMMFDTLDNVLDNPRFRDRGHFLPRDDVRAIARVIRVLTNESWTEDQLDQFDATWRDAMRSGFFAEAWESCRFRIQNAVETARTRLVEARSVRGCTQGMLW